MKKTMYYCLMLFFALTLYSTVDAQVRKVPAEVTEAFRRKYPMATNLEWRDRLSGFTASFDLDNVHYEAKFTNKGDWQNTENKIPESELSPAIKDGFQKSKYAEEWTIKEAYKIALREARTQYRLEIQKNDIQKKHLYFDSTGRLLRDNIKL
ncbi:PepSY-like domain-containing protein [Longitalea luteola]|uniref:PepSY-like domain-containing protein n=1 Tax=Longitalea luteola TaxID=2812563 RepID=UPI001A9739DA|nr:PepSY-like domain-containing protein [Longitalea luteola]